MSRAFCDEFVSEAMDDGEDVYCYRPGGLHPVHLGDQLDASRYKDRSNARPRRFFDRVAGSRLQSLKICCCEDQRIGALQPRQRA